MGYLNNTVVTVDAILTDTGRQLLAQNDGSFRITQFALADDEIDYSLWNPTHPNGSDYYGIQIENLPLLEAVPDETLSMKYKLVTLPKDSKSIPVVSISQPSINATTKVTGPITISPNTSGGSNAQGGYTAILSNKNAGTLQGEGVTSDVGSVPVFIGDDVSATAATAKGLTFKFFPANNLTSNLTTTLTIYGNQTGGSITIPVTITYVV